MAASDGVRTVTARAYRIPTDQPEADGTAQWDATTLVVAEVSADGQTGLGYTYAHESCVPLIDGVLAGSVIGGDPMDVPAMWQSMVRSVRNLGRPGLAACAISAVETALWDVKARLLNVPLAALLGRVRRSVEVYGSGGFTTYDDDATRAQLSGWVEEEQLRRVKIKIGESWGSRTGRDLARVALAREVIGADVELFVDANGGYQRGQAVRVGRQLDGYGVTWFEEPVSSDDLTGLHLVRDAVDADVTAGEYGYTLAYFAPMIERNSVDCVQVDVTRCGGIGEWMRIAALAAAHGLDVSGHCAPALHVAVAAAVPNARHLEYFHDHVRIERWLFDGMAPLRDGVLWADSDAVGNGLTLKKPDAEPFRIS